MTGTSTGASKRLRKLAKKGRTSWTLRNSGTAASKTYDGIGLPNKNNVFKRCSPKSPVGKTNWKKMGYKSYQHCVNRKGRGNK